MEKYRARSQDSDDSGKDEDDLPLAFDDLPNQEEGEPPQKRHGGSLWGDALVEQGLLQRGSRIALEKQKELLVPRGVESYQVPSTYTRAEKEDFDWCVQTEATNSNEDPFGDAPVDLDAETAFCERLSEGSWFPPARIAKNDWNRRGQGRAPNTRGRGAGRVGYFHRGERADPRRRGRGVGNGLKRSWSGKVSDPTQLLLPSYSLETLMAVEFASDISLEQLGGEMSRAMGERDPRTVKSIVQVCGMEKAIALFEETRSVESQGGMMTDDGQRRRTPGGVFISLFKLDPDIPGDVKKRLFEETKTEARKVLRAKRKGRSDFAHDVAKVAELMRKEKEKEKRNAGADLKPLPQVEQVLQPSISDIAANNGALNNSCDAEMEP